MKKKIEDIINSLLSGEKLTFEEQVFFEQWMQKTENRNKYYQLLKIRSAIYANKASKGIDYNKSWNQFQHRLKPERKIKYYRSYAAAAILAIGFFIAFTTLRNTRETANRKIAEITKVTPDQKQVILTLSTGQQVALSDSLLPMMEKNGTTIQNTGSQLVYNPTDTTSLQVYNTISIPRGAEYKLTLSDNTVVWLNSESRLTYPVAFKGTTRELKLEGEAFFEVTKDVNKPFIVHTSQFDIRVTGTQFNIRTYPEETVSATLAEGSIQLEKDHQVYRLVPGQQAYLNGEEVKVKEVDLEEAIAWRFNAFSFKKIPLEHIMNELSRWYDINIFYLNPEVKELHFTAWFRRNTPIQELLKTLEKTQQIKLELKGKTLIVAKQV